ncbi:uncharacterized protein [Nicotiana tomentosiformis]|uniref:uncharacterized protein n=1 Tax=Nicotiana tomentosiformis TaxID=4098 RepID=UPI00388CAB55
MGIVEMSGVAFTTFQMSGEAYLWWRVYEEGSQADVASLTWTQFSEIFLREFVPQTLRDAWHMEFEQLRQGNMIVLEYAVQFSDLSRHTPALVSIVRERVHRFFEGLNYGIRFSIARELEMDTPYQQVVEIARRFDGMWGREREDREAKRPQASSGAPATSRSQVAHRLLRQWLLL